MPANKKDEHVLIIAPLGQDAVAMADLLDRNGYRVEICERPAAAARQLATAGAGALLLTEEALELPQVEDLLGTLEAQPRWSELPVIVLTSGGESRLARLLELMAKAAGSITILERPVGTATLLRSLEVALRSRRRQYEVRSLLEAKALLAAIVETSDDAIVGSDLDGTIVTWNRGAQRIYGYSAEEAIGQPMSLVIPPDRLDEESNTLARIRRGESVEHFETTRRCKNGRTLEVSLTVSPLTDAQGRITGASRIARDITARKQTERALAEAQSELREHAANLEKIVADRTADLRATNEQLEAFVYSIAHDLRAPLRSMTGYSQLLLDDYAKRLDDTGAHLVKRIQASSEFMDRLLLDLLAYGRAARSEIKLAPVEIRSAWDTALFQCATQIEHARARIETVDPLGTALAHEPTLGQCLANLLSNALKFVPPGTPPEVRCRAEERGERVRVWIDDNGIGIPTSQHDRVFRVFERLHGSRYTGTGIGLSIVRKGIERMGGSVGLESEPGKGSRFWIELAKANDR